MSRDEILAALDVEERVAAVAAQTSLSPARIILHPNGRTSVLLAPGCRSHARGASCRRA